MALKFWRDAACTDEVDSGHPDTVRKAVTSGGTMTDEGPLWIKSDDAGLTYENISITAVGDHNSASATGEIDIQYALDDTGFAGVYAQSKDLPDSSFATAVKVWRKVIAPSVTSAFNDTTITHQVTMDEYLV